MNKLFVALSLSVAASLICHQARAENQEVNSFNCGPLQNSFGPYDYRLPDDPPYNTQHMLVEGAHFTPEVENLIQGKHGYLGGDIDYTLRAFPNHHRALLAMMNLTFKEKTTRPLGARYSINCYFERAERFRPDDGTVKMLLGLYKLKVGNQAEAIKKLEEAQATGEDSANLYYNLGLAYAQLKQYDKALSYAHQAYAKGFPLAGLRNVLKRAGKWSDPNPPAEPLKTETIEAVTVDAPAKEQQVKLGLEADGAALPEVKPAEDEKKDEKKVDEKKNTAAP